MAKWQDLELKVNSERLAAVIARLPEAIDCLPYEQRRVMLGFYDEGRSLSDIAELMELGVEAAKELLRMGVSDLRRQLR